MNLVSRKSEMQPRQVVIYDDQGRPVRLDRPDDLAVPHVFTFTGIYRGAYQTYFRQFFDQAMRNSRENALAMRLDEHLQACLNERIRAVANLDWHIAPDNPRDPYQRAVADGVTRVLRGMPRRRRMTKQLLKAIWFGRYGVQLKWHWRDMDLPRAQRAAVPELLPQEPLAAMPPLAGLPPAEAEPPPELERRRALTVRQHLPVNGDKIGYTWDHVPMVQIYPADAAQFPPEHVVTDNLARSLVLRERAWREQFLLHTYDPDDPDYYYPDMADAVHGLGVRHWLFWSWWTKTEFITAIADALDRFGVGVVGVYFTAGNQAEEQAADNLARNYSRRTVLKIPRAAGSSDSAGVEVVEIPTAGMQILQALRADCEAREERFLIGQTGSSRSETSGLGTHAPDMMQQTKYDLVRDDAEELAETLTGSEDEPGLVWMVQRYTYPDADFPLRFVFNVPDPAAEQRLGAATMVYNMGGALDEEEIRGVAGFRAPGPESKVLSAASAAAAAQAQAPAPEPPTEDGASVQAGQEGQEGQEDEGDPLFAAPGGADAAA